MKYLDVYKNCHGCPVQKYCGIMVSSIKLCNSYKDEQNNERQQEKQKMR